MGLFDLLEDVLGFIGARYLTKTDESVECEDSVFITI